MPTAETNATSFPSPEDAVRFDREQEKILQALERQAREDALQSGGALLALFEALPAAALAAERAEHERIVKLYGKDDARAQALEESLDGFERMEVQLARGRARAARAMAFVQKPGTAFHGFVSDAAGEPVPRMKVRVASRQAGIDLSAVTAADGYFRVALRDSPARAAAKASAREDTAADEKRTGQVAQIRIFAANGTLVHEDPLPLDLAGGTAYREYFVEPQGAAPGKRAKRTAKDTSLRRKRRRG